MSRHDGSTPPGTRRATVRDRQDAVVARLQALAADLDDTPDPRFRAATRDRLVAMAAVRAPQPAPRSGLRRLLAARVDDGPAPAWRTRLTAGLAGAALTVTALGTLAAVATDARPGDVLYGLKRGTEQTRLALAGDDRGLTLLQFARTRLDELGALPGPTATDVSGLLDTMDIQTAEGAALLAAQAVGSRDADPVAELADWAQRQTTELTALQPDLPEGAAGAAEESLELLATVTGRVTGLQAALACPAGPATTGTDALGPVPAPCPAEEATAGTPADESPSVDSGVTSGDEPIIDAPGGAPADSPAPAPRTAPSAPTGGDDSGDRGTGSSPGGSGGEVTTPAVPRVPTDDGPLVTVPESPLPSPPVVTENSDDPLLDAPLSICIRPLVC
ncbi:hypothetical protein E4P41_18505 [Geodermatophilus sp. DF01-2]|uniref:DUF5667 domain-containing protein n=1 Tax=Geodermatophilus sp. DF01-2 TaxID=2559610 RepID=UPI001073A592|nr:DUF5667 domain-containing protein [Geodermatophilus sp. DF01_2]TFV54634.1 hypothetical protein E4P41_18505 [Geodermatophilus sp. DF01_2]